MTDAPQREGMPDDATRRVYWTGWWRFGSYKIGTTRVLMLGPLRVFL